MEWGEARTQVIAHKQEIERRIAAGEPLRKIYNDLKTRDVIAMSEPAFYRNVKRLDGLAPEPTASLRRDGTRATDGHEQAPAPALTTPTTSAAPRSSIEGIRNVGKQPLDELWGGTSSDEKV